MPEDEPMRVISGLAGAALLVLTAGSILRNVVIPRGLGSVLTRVLWRMLRQLLLLAARPFHTYEARDKMLAWLAPMVLVSTLLSWLASLFGGYGLIMYGVSQLPPPASFREAGSSLFTPGDASATGRNPTALHFLADAH